LPRRGEQEKAMDSSTVLQLVYATFVLTAKISAPLLLTALLVGLLVSLFQAVTQLNDSTLSFLPKLIAVALVLWVSWSWLMQEIIAYTGNIFQMLEHVAR